MVGRRAQTAVADGSSRGRWDGAWRRPRRTAAPAADGTAPAGGRGGRWPGRGGWDGARRRPNDGSRSRPWRTADGGPRGGWDGSRRRARRTADPAADGTALRGGQDSERRGVRRLPRGPGRRPRRVEAAALLLSVPPPPALPPLVGRPTLRRRRRHPRRPSLPPSLLSRRRCTSATGGGRKLRLRGGGVGLDSPPSHGAGMRSFCAVEG